MKIKLLRLFMTAAILLCLPNLNYGQAPNLGKAATYAVFTDTGAFNTTGSTIIYGDIGSYVGAVNGSPTVYGTKHYGDSTAYYVSIDVDKAYSELQSRTCGSVLGTTLGSSQTLYPGIYCTGAATTLGGNLILDAQGNASAIFIIKIGGAFATGSSANILLINKASYKNVYWQIDGALSVGNSSTFAGTIIANGAITFSGSASLAGRALSISGAITLSSSAMIRDSALIGSGAITSQPDSLIRCLGTSASFFITTADTGYAYQWRKGSTNITNGGRFSGAKSDTLTINPITSADALNNYNVIISKSGFPNDTSRNVSLKINSVTAATVAGQTVCAGSNAIFKVIPTSTGPASLSYQWKLSTNGGTSYANITGATNASYTVTAPGSSSDNNQYICLVSSGSCSSYTSTAGTLRVNSVTAATVAGQTVCSGSNAIFTVSPTSSGSAALTYQWLLSTNGGTSFSTITGATASSYTVTAPNGTSDNNQYENIVTSTGCGSYTSTAGTLRVNGISAATVAGQTVCSGSNAIFTVSTTASGSAALTYQWLVSTNGGTSFSTITGATASSYTVTAPNGTSDNNQYENIVTSTGCGSFTSTAGKLRVNGISAAAVAGQTVCSGTDAVFTVSPTSTGSATLTYQWLISTNGGTSFSTITGATASSYTVTSPAGSADNNQYENIVTSTGCGSYTSTAGTLRVNGISAATVAGKATCSGTDAVFTVSTTSTGSAALSYQWKISTNGGTSFSNISGATASTYTVSSPGGSSDNNQYLCVVSSGSCASFNSTAGTLRVNNVSAASVANVTVCSGNDAVFTVSQTSTGSASLSYQWMLSTNGGTTFSNISGATSASYTVTVPGASSDLYQYKNVVTSGTCGAFTSTAGTLRVNAVTTAAILGQTVCSGTDATFTVAATNSGPASLSYQWKESINGGTSFSNITGATTTTYVVTAPGASSDNYQFENMVTSGSCAAFASNAATLRVNAITSATVSGATVCSGNNAGFTVSVSHTGPASLSYQWKMSTDKGATFSDISGATNAAFTETSTGAASDNNQYECIVTSGTCNPFTSTVATMRVNAITSAIVSNETVCAATDATFSVTVTNTGSASLSYQWMKSVDGGVSFADISGATAADYTVTSPDPTFDNYEYKCIVTSGSCASDTSNAGILRVNAVTGALVASQIVCSGADAVFNSYVINTGSGVLSYQWKISTNGGASFSNITNTNNASYTVASPDGSYDNNEYEFTIASASCPAFSSTAAILRVNSAVSAPVLGNTVCANSDAVFVSSPTSTGPASLTYQWQLSSDGGLSFTDIKGAKDTLYTVIAPDATSDNYEYRNLITSGTCPAYTSSTGVLRVNDITASTVASQSVCSGFDATFTNVVTSSGPAFLTYQWKRSTDGGVTFVAIPGATGTTFTVAAPTSTSDGYQYENIVTSAGCMSYTSNAGILSLNAAPNIIGGPENACVCVYTNASFWVNATGTDLRYQWRRGNVNLVDSGRISGSNTDVLTINGVIIYDTAANYNVIVMGTCSPNDTSNNVVLSLCKQSGISPANAANNNTISIFPNPFTSSASVSFIASKSENVNASVYDVRGEKIQTLYDGSVVANNTYTYELKGAGLTPGIYFVRLTSQSNVQYVKVMKLKN